MNITIENAKDIMELTQFLSLLNTKKQSHIGYCGEQIEEICHTLIEDFVDEDGDIKFLVARNNNGEILAAIGVDIDETSAEVWGPFNRTASIKLQHQLWERLKNDNPTIHTFYFFINKENTLQQTFMKELNASKTGEHLVLEVKEQFFNKVSELKSTSFTQSDFKAFEKLHKETFPNTYYDAKTITGRLSNERILKLFKTESNKLQGYAYFEIDTEMKDATLEYIAISPDFQGQGLGTRLLKEILTEMFAYPQIKEIKLCVNNTNNKANHVYMKAGFETKDILISYCLKR